MARCMCLYMHMCARLLAFQDSVLLQITGSKRFTIIDPVPLHTASCACTYACTCTHIH